MTRTNNPSEERIMSETAITDVERRGARGAPDSGTTASESSERTLRAYEIHDSVAERRLRIYRINRVTYFIFGLLEGLIAIRFLLKLFGANPNAPFTALMYGVTEPFIAFFRNIFPASNSGVGVLEPEAVMAFIIYALLGWAIGQVVLLVFDREP